MGMNLSEKKLEKPQAFADEYLGVVDENEVAIISDEIIQSFMSSESSFGNFKHL